MATATPEEFYQESVDQRVVLPRASWQAYGTLVAARGEAATPRISFLNGELELMTPSVSHERIKKLLGRLIEAWALETDTPLIGYGSVTLQKATKRRGVEADESYVVGRKPKRVPDIALEIEWTPGGIDKLDIYRGLGVREVWWWRDGVIDVYVLSGGEYERRRRSVLLPGLDLGRVGRLAEASDHHQAVVDFIATVRRN